MQTQEPISHDDNMTELREILWPCQTDIAEAYGLPGTSEGLQRIQNAVQRAITEGDVEIRCLADEALMLLGMSPLQNIIQEVKAEDRTPICCVLSYFFSIVVPIRPCYAGLLELHLLGCRGQQRHRSRRVLAESQMRDAAGCLGMTCLRCSR